MTSTVAFQQLAQSLGQVKILLSKVDDQVQQGLRVDPHNKFLNDLENLLSNKIVETNHAIKIAYERGTLLSSNKSKTSNQPSVESSARRERAFVNAA
jgi:nitrite reductase/ring-hydroxylating ferredoxin subunit